MQLRPSGKAGSVAVNIAASITLFQFYAFAGIAAGTTIAAWVNAGLLGATLAKRGGFVPDAQVLTRLPLIVVASAAMGAALWYGALYAAPWFEGTFLESVAALADCVREFRGAVVVVSHDQFFVNAVCDEAWVVNNGKVKKAASFQAYVERQVRKLER